MDALPCADCKLCTSKLGEYYMVKRDIWRVFGVRSGYLCIGCLENRLGRVLEPADFTNSPVNTLLWVSVKSKRLLKRLGFA